MLYRLSRILFWIAAIAAVMALVGPTALATAMTALAGIGVLAAYVAARGGLQWERRTSGPAPEHEGPVLSSEALVEIAGLVEVAIASAPPGVERASLAAADVLRAELGARETAVHRVRGMNPPFVDLVTLASDGHPGVGHRLRLERSPLGVALRDGCVTRGEAGSYAIPISEAAGPVAAIELGPPALRAAPGILEGFFERVATMLAGAASAPQNVMKSAEALPDRSACDIRTPPGGTATPLQEAPRDGCRSQYIDTDASTDCLTARAVPDSPIRSEMASALDAVALAKLRELDPTGETRLVERVLRAFETSAVRLQEQLDAACTGGDRAGIRHVAHTLKSSSASIGALALSRHCATVEALIREDHPDSLDAPLAALRVELAAARNAIRSMIDTAA